MRVKLFFVILFLCIVGLFVRAQLTTFPVTGGGSGATTVAGLSDAGTAAYSNATAFALAQSGTIVTQNNSFSLLLSNAVKLDAAHSLSLSNATASTLALFGADKSLGSAAASGAVPIDADWTATTFAQVNALAPGFVHTNANNNAIVIFTNNLVSLNMNGSGIFTLTNYAAAGLGWSVSTNGSVTNTGNIQSATLKLTSTADGPSDANVFSGTAFTTSGYLRINGGVVAIGAAGANINYLVEGASQNRVVAGSGWLNGWSSNTVGSGTSLRDSMDTAFGRGSAGNIYATNQTAASTWSTFTSGGLLIPTNYVAANFTPVAGMVKICSSNGILWKVTQQSTNLLNSVVP